MNVKQEVRDLLQCPIDWDQIVPEHELNIWLRFCWFAKIRRVQVDGEVENLFCSDDFLVDEASLGLFEEELEPIAKNIETWISKQRECYQDFFRRLSKMTCVGPEVYAKHYPSKNCSDIEAASASKKKGVSILFPSVDVNEQRKYFWAALNSLVERSLHFSTEEAFHDPEKYVDDLMDFFEKLSLGLSVIFPKSIGACSGESTAYGFIDIDFSTPQFHLYPISKTEYERGRNK